MRSVKLYNCGGFWKIKSHEILINRELVVLMYKVAHQEKPAVEQFSSRRGFGPVGWKRASSGVRRRSAVHVFRSSI